MMHLLMSQHALAMMYHALAMLASPVHQLAYPSSYPIPAHEPPQDGYTLSNARARNVRARARACARGMNPRWKADTLF